MYVKMFVQMYDGTLCTVGPWEALVTFQQMLILANRDGVVDMTAEAISRRTTIPLEIITRGIDVLVRNDPKSRNLTEGGKRLIPLYDHLDWGWKVVSYEHYRGIKREDDRREYHREYWQKRKAKNLDQETNSTNSTNVLNTQHHSTTKHTKEVPQPQSYQQLGDDLSSTTVEPHIITTYGSNIMSSSTTVDRFLHKNLSNTKENKQRKVISPKAKLPVSLQRKQFQKPTREELATYCAEAHIKIDQDAFLDYNESSGWLVGKKPMKDWKAAVRNWHRRDFTNQSRGNSNDRYDELAGLPKF